MAAVSAADDPTAAESEGRRPIGRAAVAARAALRLEDLALAGWLAVAAPLLAQGAGASSGGGGPFDPGRPIQGLLGLAGLVGALICLATRTSDRPDSPDYSVVDGGVIGPVVGGMMAVGASAFAGLGLGAEAGLFLPFVAVMIAPAFRSHVPTIPAVTRRVLVTPFVLAAGGIFWSFVRGVTGGRSVGVDLGSLGALAAQAQVVAPVLGLLALGAAVYYAMLIYAPRQIAEREGGPITWVARYLLFLVSVLFGLGWLSLLGG